MNLCGKIISKFVWLHTPAIIMAVIFIFTLTNAYSQTAITTTTDSIKHISDTVKIDTLSAKNNTKDSVANDTTTRSKVEKDLGIKISKDALSSVVKADASDSAVMDMRKNLFYLYNNAKVKYEDKQLDAGRIVYDQATGIVTAEPLTDTITSATLRPSFTQGADKFTYDSVQYNFKSVRLIGRNVRSQYGEGYMYSEQIKRNPDQSVYAKYSIYTTCALDTPHFGIVARRIKVIPGRVIASGSANITIEGVPTPLFLPFGIFPISQTQRSGFVLPTYTIEQSRGLGLINGGYYFYLSDHADLLTEANIFSKGSWAISSLSNYMSRYHYSGNFSFAYAYNKTGEDYEQGSSITKDFRLVWRHQSDAKAKPGQTFNVSIDAGTNSYYSNNSYDPNKILQNQYSSNVSFSKNWQGTPFSFTMSARHSQNTANRTIQMTLPEMNFFIAQINPFQRKTSIGSHWYDKITVSYTVHALNTATFVDSTFGFNSLAQNNMQNGLSHSIPISASYTVFRFINMSFSVNYNEYWLTDKLYEQYNNTNLKIDSADTHGFYTARDFNTGVQFTTRIYGTKFFKSGRIKGIRHVLTPNVGFTYRPDFGASPFNYGYYTHLDTTSVLRYLSPYSTSVVGYPQLGKQGAINFGINNNLQMKVRSNKDTVTGYKNISLIDGFSINTGYNLAADSFQWSAIAVGFRTNVLDKVNITANATFDPYALDYNTGRRLPQTLWDMGGGIGRFTSATVALGSNFHSAPKSGDTKTTNSEEYNRIMHNNAYNDYLDFHIPWSLNLSYALSVNSNWTPFSKSDTLVYTQNIMFSGDFNLTERWKVTVSSGFDFTNHQLTLTQLGIFRDLHCWQMSMTTIPFGPRKNYTFTLNVKASALQDLKLLRRRDYRDAAQ